MRALLVLGLLLMFAPFASAGFPTAGSVETPGNDHDHDGNWDVVVCVWGFDDGCVLRAYECFQPHRPGFGINCI